jgi:hypothetical protein
MLISMMGFTGFDTKYGAVLITVILKVETGLRAIESFTITDMEYTPRL